MAANFNPPRTPGIFGYRAIQVLRHTLVVMGSALLASVTLLALFAFFDSRAAAAAPLQGTGAGVPVLEERLMAGLYFKGRQDDAAYEAPTLSSDVAIDLAGQVARVTVRQRFRNPSKAWLEGIYVFPLPDKSAVDRLVMTVGDRKVEGRILEKAEAERVYREAAAQGRKASLLSSERPNVFVTAVANIGPGEEVTIEIGYQDRARFDGGRFTYRFPMVVAPRYTPGLGGMPLVRAPLEPPESYPRVQRIAHRISQPDGGATNEERARDLFGPVRRPEDGLANPVSLRVLLDPGRPLAALDSLYHPVRVEALDERRRVLTLAEGSVPADRDFVLEWRHEASALPEAMIFGEEIDGEAHLLVTLLPPTEQDAIAADQPRPPRDLIFVIDTSGSMHGPSIEQAKEALVFALDRLGPEGRFNLIRFASDSEALFTAARPASADNLRRAKAYVHSLEADGGTEMQPALILALDEAPMPGRLRQVVFLTDGAVGNEQDLFMVIAGRLGAARLFTIGIGSAPNSYFMRKAAELGRGSFTHIGDLGEVSARMTALFDKLERPALTDLALSWPDSAGRGVEPYPGRIPDLYAGEPVSFTARLGGVALGDLDGELLLTGRRGDQLWERRLQLGSGLVAPGVAALWAREKFAEIVDGFALGRDPVEVRSQALAVALRHGLVTRFTSLVAVDDLVSRPDGAGLEGAEIPRNLPHGMDYDHIFGELHKTMELRQLPAPLLRQASAAGGQPVALPQTATPAGLLILTGAGFLLAGICLLIAFAKVRRAGVAA